MARTGSLDGDGNTDLAGSETSVSRSGPCRTQAQIISFPKPVLPPREGFGDVGGSSSWPPTFHSIGDLTHAVVMRLQSDLPRIRVSGPSREEDNSDRS